MLGIIGLILKIVFMLPSLIKTGMAIIALLPRFKDGGLWNDLGVILDIVKLIMGLAQSDKKLATDSFDELHGTMAEGGQGLRARLEVLRARLRERRRHSVVFSGADTVQD